MCLERAHALNVLSYRFAHRHGPLSPPTKWGYSPCTPSAPIPAGVSGRGRSNAPDTLPTRWEFPTVQGSLSIIGAPTIVAAVVYVAHHALSGEDMRNIPIVAATLLSIGWSLSKISIASLLSAELTPRGEELCREIR